MARLCEQPTVILEALAIHEVLRRLGFVSDNLYVELGDDADDWFVVVLKLSDGSLFKCIAGLQGMSYDEAADVWVSAVQIWNSASPDDTNVVFRNSAVFKGAIGLTRAMKACGIVLPVELN